MPPSRTARACWRARWRRSAHASTPALRCRRSAKARCVRPARHAACAGAITGATAARRLPVQLEPAYRADGRDCDEARFYALACEPSRSGVVEACAGAGKTWMLVSRIVRALLDGAAPDEILAITFTGKAASEMRVRLHDWLRQFASHVPPRRREALRARGVMRARTARLAGVLPQA